MNTEQALEYCKIHKKNFSHSYNVLSGFIDAAEDALRVQAEQENPKPLAEAQLWDMVGQPVYFTGINKWGIIGIRNRQEDDQRLVVGFAYGWEWIEDVLYTGRRAYRYRPKEAR